MSAPTPVAPTQTETESGGLAGELWRSREVRWSGFSGLLIAAGYAAGPLGAPGAVSTALFIAAAVVGARFFAAEAVEELVREREIGIELLMTVAAVVAGVLGAWSEAAALAFLYSISESLEEFTEDRTRDAIRKLLDLAPRRVTLLGADGSEREVDVDDKDLKRVEAIIQSMTPQERRNPKIIGGSRKRRIAAGSGTSPQEVNRLLKQHTEAQKMMKSLAGGKGLPNLGALGGGRRNKR